MMDSEKWQRYINNQCDPEERKEIVLWLQRLPAGELDKIMEQGWQDDAPAMPEDVDQRIWMGLREKIRTPAISAYYRMPELAWMAAACMLLLTGVLVWLWLDRRPGVGVERPIV